MSEEATQIELRYVKRDRCMRYGLSRLGTRDSERHRGSPHCRSLTMAGHVAALAPPAHRTQIVTYAKKGTSRFNKAYDPIFLSTASNRFKSSGSFLKITVLRRQTLLSISGDPDTTLPGSISWPIPDCAVTTTPSPIVR